MIPDLQSPFQHPDTIPFLRYVYKHYRCDNVVCIGDEVDWKFLKFRSVNDPHSAMTQHKMALQFMKELYRIYPRVQVCNSNHSERLVSAAERGEVPAFLLKSTEEALQAPKEWVWRDFWEVDGVRYEHGHRFNGGYPHIQAVNTNFQSTIIGHFASRLCVDYMPRGKRIHIGAIVGCLVVDWKTRHKMSYGMRYAKKYRGSQALGCMVVIDGKQAIAVPYSPGL